MSGAPEVNFCLFTTDPPLPFSNTGKRYRISRSAVGTKVLSSLTENRNDCRIDPLRIRFCTGEQKQPARFRTSPF
jgi:hypothetical protein